MPKIIKFSLTNKECELLHQFMKKGIAGAREYKRAEVLLMLHNQLHATDIREIFKIPDTTTTRIRKNYEKGGLEKALFDENRSGRPKKFTPGQRAKITALACSKPPEGRGRWTLNLMADKLVQLSFVESISRSQVARILKKTK